MRRALKKNKKQHIVTQCRFVSGPIYYHHTGEECVRRVLTETDQEASARIGCAAHIPDFYGRGWGHSTFHVTFTANNPSRLKKKKEKISPGKQSHVLIEFTHGQKPHVVYDMIRPVETRSSIEIKRVSSRVFISMSSMQLSPSDSSPCVANMRC